MQKQSFSSAVGAVFERVEIAESGDLITPQPLSVDAKWVADLDEDGNYDLLSGRGVSISYGTSAGGFEEPVRVNRFVNGDPQHIQAVDLDGDGHQDIVAWELRGTQESGVHVFWGSGDRGFTESQLLTARPPFMVIGDASLADVNGDSILDVISVSPGTSVDEDALLGVAFGKGDRQFEATTHFPLNGPSNNPEQIEVGDFNNDGFVDLFITLPRANDDDPANRLALFTGRGDGSFTFTNDLRVGRDQSSEKLLRIASADLDGNGTLDLVAAVPMLGSMYDPGNVTIFLGDGTGEFPTRHEISSDAPTGLEIADWNGDGSLDIAVGHRTKIGLFAG